MITQDKISVLLIQDCGETIWCYLSNMMVTLKLQSSKVAVHKWKWFRPKYIYIYFFELPNQSPDLHPTEHLWWYLKTAVYSWFQFRLILSYLKRSCKRHIPRDLEKHLLWEMVHCSSTSHLWTTWSSSITLRHNKIQWSGVCYKEKCEKVHDLWIVLTTFFKITY